MRISVVFTKGERPGGSEELALRVIEEALKVKDSVLLSYYGKEIPDDEKVIKLIEIGLQLHEIYLPNLSNLFGKLLFYIYKKKNIISLFHGISNFNPDLIIVSQGGTYDLPSNVPLSKFLLSNRFPFFVISQFHSETGTLESSLRKKARTMFSRAQSVFFVSKRNKEIAEMFLAQSIENAEVINNPIKLIDRIYVDYPEGKLVNFGCVARLEAGVKGQNILLKILSTEKWKERDWKLNFYGEGPDLAYLKELADYFGISGKVNFCGFSKDVRRIWADNNVFVLPSLAEGTPLSLIEASICGRTAVVADVGGNSDLVIDGITGFLADSNSVIAFDKALERAWQEKSNWKEMGLRAKERVQNIIDMNIEKSLLKRIKNLN